MQLKQFLRSLAEQLVHELEPILKIKEVTRNSALLGAYTEAAMRRLIARVVHPMHVSTGAIIDFPMPHTLVQIDAVIWSPFPAPGIFEIDEFALVPRSSAFGVLEIKRSNYTGVDEKIEEFSALASSLVAAPNEKAGDHGHPGMGIVCVLEGSISARLKVLFDSDKAVAIFHKQTAASDEATVRVHDVVRLVNFLHFVTWRHRRQSTLNEYPQVVLAEQA